MTEREEFFKATDEAKSALQRAIELEAKIGFDYPCREELQQAVKEVEEAEFKAGFGNSEEEEDA